MKSDWNFSIIACAAMYNTTSVRISHSIEKYPTIHTAHLLKITSLEGRAQFVDFVLPQKVPWTTIGKTCTVVQRTTCLACDLCGSSPGGLVCRGEKRRLDRQRWRENNHVWGNSWCYRPSDLRCARVDWCWKRARWRWFRKIIVNKRQKDFCFC